MLCENCGERPAAIHLTQIVNDSVNTVHLCDQCAHEKGVDTEASLSKFPLSEFLASSIGKSEGEATSTDLVGRCTACHSSLQDFRESGRLGCPVCYDTFQNHLRDLLRRLHGSSHHVGKMGAAPTPAAEDVRGQLRTLRDQLQQAVSSEQFELAAELRDRIRGLEANA